MERVDIVWAPLVRGAGLTLARPKAPHIARRALSRVALAPPAHDHTNAYYAAEVQSIFEPRRA